MRKAWLLALLLPAVVLAAPLTFKPDVQVSLSNCAANGSTTATLQKGTWLLTTTTTTGEELWFCYAATCASGGVYLPPGAMLHVNVDVATSVSCRSAGATGDLQYTRG